MLMGGKLVSMFLFRFTKLKGCVQSIKRWYEVS